MLADVKELLECQVLCGDNNLHLEIEVANASDLMSDVLSFAEPDTLLLTGLVNNHVIRTCQVAGVCAIIFVKNKMPSVETIEFAKACNLPILATKLSMFDACGILYANGITGSTPGK